MKKLKDISLIIRETDDFKHSIEIDQNIQLTITGGNLIEIPYVVIMENKLTGEKIVTKKVKRATSIKDVPLQNSNGEPILGEENNPIFLSEFEEYEKSELGQGIIGLIEAMFLRIKNNEPLVFTI